MAGEQPSIARFLKEDFIGGTLVEYEDGFGFKFEWGRAMIEDVSIDEDGYFKIETDGEACAGMAEEIYASEYMQLVEKKNGIFYISHPYLSCWALAPKGVEIPKKETLHEYCERIYKITLN